MFKGKIENFNNMVSLELICWNKGYFFFLHNLQNAVCMNYLFLVLSVSWLLKKCKYSGKLSIY